jgi:carbohydrate kinase (thermoresistant glucokinase family)
LKKAYRDILRGSLPNSMTRFVYLRSSESLITKRVLARKGHFFSGSNGLVQSQFQTLEDPTLTGECGIIAVSLLEDENEENRGVKNEDSSLSLSAREKSINRVVDEIVTQLDT